MRDLGVGRALRHQLSDQQVPGAEWMVRCEHLVAWEGSQLDAWANGRDLRLGRLDAVAEMVKPMIRQPC